MCKRTTCKGCGLFLRKDHDEYTSPYPGSRQPNVTLYMSTPPPMKQKPENCKRFLESVEPGCPREFPNDMYYPEDSIEQDLTRMLL